MSASVTIKPAGSRPPALAKGLPVTLEFPGKTARTVSIADVKAALQAKFPRVRWCFPGPPLVRSSSLTMIACIHADNLCTLVHCAASKA